MTKVVEALTQDNQGLAKLPNKIGANLSGARSRLQTFAVLADKICCKAHTVTRPYVSARVTRVLFHTL